MKRFIIFVFLGGIVAAIFNYLGFIKLPESSFVLGMWFGGVASIFWPLILSILKLIYALLSLCFAMLSLLVKKLWLLVKIALFALLLLAYPFVFIAVTIIGLVCIVFVPGTKIEMPKAFSRLNIKKLKSQSKKIDDRDEHDESE